MIADMTDKAEAFITGFSFKSNMTKIFSTKTPKTDFDAIHGIRFLSLCYLMLGETYVLGTLFTEIWAVGMYELFEICFTCMKITMNCKDGSRYRGLFAHFFMQLLG